MAWRSPCCLRPAPLCVELAPTQLWGYRADAHSRQLYWHQDPLKAQGRTRVTIGELDLRQMDRPHRGGPAGHTSCLSLVPSLQAGPEWLSLEGA